MGFKWGWREILSLSMLKYRHKSQEKVATITGVPQRTISEWKQGNANDTEIGNACLPEGTVPFYAKIKTKNPFADLCRDNWDLRRI